MITVKNLYKQFGDHVVLKNISETIRDGEKIVVIGPRALVKAPSCVA